ncbi:GTPase Era [Acidaminobacter sp. JC074]|uniref:GTPase Era n=1 Tax=Acidaminobacter sp. JC074 TaxID=2530199 RepID=UPI001F0E2EDA|nr:GTPase Era [Acidaminobacter sp. JC074]MCH4887712.1 GTPase Era [Acidaminobacter sp. JC074]
MSFKSGFVTIVGRPNVGKSTLLNHILGEKIAIMSDKPQTTRNKIMAIHQREESQVIFMDTPGMHKPKHKLGEYMMKAATETLKEVDLVLFMVDDSKKIGPGDQWILDTLKEAKVKVYLIINKMDLLAIEDYAQIVENYKAYDFIEEIIGLSAINNKNVDVLMDKIIDALPEGPMYYPDDMITDQPEKVIVGEIIREKILHYIRDEIPHGVAVEVEKMRKRENSEIYDIEATIICEKNSHKGILIGKGGRKLKGIGKSAREDIERFLDMKVFLQLWVKVRPGWRDNDMQLKNLGYRHNKY